jgi:hypothetical protein
VRAWGWLLLLGGCRAAAPPAVDAATGCPPVALIEALHAATFHFEHGSAGEGRADLARARSLARDAPDAEVARVLARLAVVDAAIDAQPDRARGELEQIRAAFRDWRCMPEPLHQRFHAALPALP